MTTIVLTILGVLLVWQVVIRLFRKRYHFPAPAFIGRFLDSDIRREMQPPDKLIERSGIKQGMRVLEVGCGSGAFVTSVARVVGKTGKVYALDIQPAMLRQLKVKLTKPENQDIKNIKLILGSAYKLPFEDNSIDLVYMVTVLQETPDKQKALKEAGRVLKPGGVLAVTEFLPDPDYPLKSTTIKIGEEAGFILDKVLGNFWNYTVRFVKQL
ncbi:MAG: Menaquinone biosynthesis methyltransferase (2-heptaprenyl-1, 4-naphthoquinone methyltransferase) [Candidatus Woesebacteria bacterium GW2011_GWB1_38_5b]|uniref:Menaquinone biosynthesis methyltransferase (2-heptaprenyl-1, 4-naphthoquinone methyltransferase) n=1 Tax=Candidatus Woesebacteria bacterium GW2011_GWB1_38_5b TaxID=1618569 RepID=A0A0G0K687_9BACT|nr:MAG: Menaquinone biosynthesis methyltransferase (2-heptaprenyl-1, 4-naphthoquinone methyltransferase) [Candidatus Woesebacteria bacterium GW2011_GWB1_38_5b]